MSPATASVKVSAKVKAIVKAHKGDAEDLIAILQDLQAEHRYLPQDKLVEVAFELGVPINRVYAIATFFRAFSLTPKGEHDVHVCTGTACHVRGAPRIVDQLERMLGAGVRETSKDGKFSLDTVSCVGSCALGPVITVDGELHGKVALRDLKKIMKTYQSKESASNEVKKSGGPGKKKGRSKKVKKSK